MAAPPVVPSRNQASYWEKQQQLLYSPSPPPPAPFSVMIPPPLPARKPRVRALWEFQGLTAGDLPFHVCVSPYDLLLLTPGEAGDIIIVTNKLDPGWWEGELFGNIGMSSCGRLDRQLNVRKASFRMRTSKSFTLPALRFRPRPPCPLLPLCPAVIPAHILLCIRQSWASPLLRKQS